MERVLWIECIVGLDFNDGHVLSATIYVSKTNAQLRCWTCAKLRVPVLTVSKLDTAILSTARNAHLRETRFQRICARRLCLGFAALLRETVSHGGRP